MVSATRPTSAYLIPIALTALGTLDLSAALMHGGSLASVNAALGMAAYVATAFGGAVEWTAAALLLMRRSLGRSLYVVLLPVRIAIIATAASLAYSAAPALGSDYAASEWRAAVLGLALDVAIYAVLVVAMFRPAFAAWLSGSVPAAATASVEAPPRRAELRRIVAHPASRIAAFIAVLLFTVFVLDAPLALLWAGAAAVVLMLGVRAYLLRR